MADTDAPAWQQAPSASAPDGMPALPPVAFAPLFAARADAAPFWLGVMVPKRWARRAVTRNAIRRQVYAVAAALPGGLPAGACLVRLRAAFATADFPSATSRALRAAVRAELQKLFARAMSPGMAFGQLGQAADGRAPQGGAWA